MTITVCTHLEKFVKIFSNYFFNVFGDFSIFRDFSRFLARNRANSRSFALKIFFKTRKNAKNHEKQNLINFESKLKIIIKNSKKLKKSTNSGRREKARIHASNGEFSRIRTISRDFSPLAKANSREFSRIRENRAKTR